MSADPFRDRTEQSDGSFPENWPRPNPGDFIIGEVTNIALNAGKYDQPVLGILCEDTHREWSVWLPQYLRDEITREDLKPGERVSIKYFGLKKGRNREYQHYSMMIDPRSRIASAPKSEDDPRTDDQKREDFQQKFHEREPAPAQNASGGPWDDDDLPF